MKLDSWLSECRGCTVAIEDQFSASASIRNWHELYRTAILETDPQKLQSRIADAEKAIILRGRELFAVSGDTSEEAEALDDALYGLRGLRNCVRFKTRES